MKRFRVKVVGLGLALAAGSAAVAADGDWRAPGAPATPAGAPGLLPPALRAPKTEPAAIWLPARDTPPAPLVVPAGGSPAPQQPTKWAPEPTGGAPGGPLSEGPRANPDPFGPLPAIPDLPAAPEQPPIPPAPVAPAAPLTRQPDPVPPPRPVEPPPKPPMMTQPRAPEFAPPPKAEPIPTPRPVETPPTAPQPELQPAPPELMYPAGALEVNKHATFGSAPIRISRDYPSLHDLTHGGDDGSLSNRVFVRGEYLLWWMPGFPVPVLGTTNANTATNAQFDEPGTATILGPGALLDSTRSGFRIRAGAWLNDSHSCGIDAGFFFLGNQSDTAARGAAQFPLINRPIFSPNVDPTTGTAFGEFGELVSVPGILNGTLSAQSDSRLWGADVNVRRCLFTKCDSRAELFVGYRHLNLRETLTIGENILVVGTTGSRGVIITDPVGTRVVVQDRFQTRNYFNGGQIGAAYERQFGRWDVDARASVALGATRQVLEISGFQTRTQPNGTVMSFNGGLLAAGPNLGQFERTAFSVAPELTLNVGYWVLPRMRVFAGYNFLMWTNVIRPGDQIDRVVDLTFVPNAPAAVPSGQNRPRPLFAERDLILHGVQLGLELRW